MIQLPEPCDEKSEALKAGYKTIAEIGKERIRRAAAKIKEENPEYVGDLGFKVFKLDSSNIRAWNPDRNDLEQTLIDHMEHLVEGRSEEDVLYELLLKRGVELTVPIEERLIQTTEHTEDTEKEKKIRCIPSATGSSSPASTNPPILMKLKPPHRVLSTGTRNWNPPATHRWCFATAPLPTTLPRPT